MGGLLFVARIEGIKLKKPNDLAIRIYADASYGGEEARSQTGVLITLGKHAVGWYSRRQDIISLLITKAEYIANCEGGKDAAWMAQFLQELGIVSKPALYTDSEGAYNLSKASKFARRSRHIEHRFHYLGSRSEPNN